MPSTIKVRVVAARDLPVMDPSSQATDAYCEIKFGDTHPQKTDIAKKTLAPKWNQDFRIEVLNDEELQEEPLEIKVWDHDLVSADDAIGLVTLDLNPLLSQPGGGQISGWFPIFDTLRGIRGDLCVSVKLTFFGDANRYKETSSGVQFFSAPCPPQSRRLLSLLGFVEELAVEADPEHHWTDTFRTSRTSNEARQLLLHQLSGKIRRQLGSKVKEMGGNAVIGFRQHFDLEGENGITARGYGTAAYLQHYEPVVMPASAPAAASGAAGAGDSLSRSLSPGKALLSAGPGGLDVGDAAGVPASLLDQRRPNDVSLLTLTSLPAHITVRLGGMVGARAVKVLSDDGDTQEARDAWWKEIREEVRSHARAMGCRFVTGYSETVAITGDVCVLSAQGTACKLRKRSRMSMRKALPMCMLCHTPYSVHTSPFQMKLSKCDMCRSKPVPEVLLATVEVPANAPVVGEGVLLEARVCRPKRAAQGDTNAIAISDGLPFLEYELHRQINYKLKLLGLNAAFGVQVNITLGKSMMVAVATATGVFLKPLPTPPLLCFRRNLEVLDREDQQLLAIQKALEQRSVQSRERLREDLDAWAELFGGRSSSSSSSSGSDSDTDTESSSSSEDEDERTKQAFVVDVDDEADEDSMAVLLDPELMGNVRLCATQSVPSPRKRGLLVQQELLVGATTMPWGDVPPHRFNIQLARLFNDMYARLSFRLRRFPECHVCALRPSVHIGHNDSVQLFLSGSVITSGRIERDHSLHSLPDELAAALPTLRSAASSPQLGPAASPVVASMSPGTVATATATAATAAQSPGESVLERRRNESISVDVPATPDFDAMGASRSWDGAAGSASAAAATAAAAAHGRPRHFHTNVVLSPLSQLPHHPVLEAALGHVNLHFIRESWTVREQGGVGALLSTFLMEVHAIARALIVSLGGNALVSYHVDTHVVDHAYKNHAYALISLSGDCVRVR